MRCMQAQNTKHRNQFLERRVKYEALLMNLSNALTCTRIFLDIFILGNIQEKVTSHRRERGK